MRKTNPLGSQPAGRPAPPPSGAAAGAGPDAQALVRDLPWGVVVLDAHGTVLRLNEQAAAWWGVPPPAGQGQPLGEATAGTLPPDLRQVLQRVPGSPEPVPGEFFLPQHQQWIAMTSARRGDPIGKPDSGVMRAVALESRSLPTVTSARSTDGMAA